ncbi:MAG: hypothetical protein LQ349_007414, partial [Xanthoria aureola]
ALRFALLTVYQLGRFINSDMYPDAASSYLVGVCTASFAASAISASRTMTELVPAAVQAVLVAFRVGLHSLKMQRHIELWSDEGSRSWSQIFSLSEAKAQEILRQFNSEALATLCERYDSLYGDNQWTSERVRALYQLVQPPSSPDLNPDPYHAPHLNDIEDIDEILGCLGDERFGNYRPRIPLLSAAAGTLMEAEDFAGLLRQAATEALCQQVRWDKICSGLSSMLSQNPSLTSCIVSPVASNAASLLSCALQRDTTLSLTISESLNTKVESDHMSPAAGGYQDSKIAIVGYSGRFPEAASTEELWEILKAVRDTHRTVPEDRFDWKAHYDSSGKTKNASQVKHGCFITDPGVFDARFFNISPREAENMDPGQRLALMAVYEAIEMAGLVPDRTPSTRSDRIGVFFGVTSDDWREVNSGQDIDTYFIPGGNRAFIPGRMSYFFRFSGPSISVDTACSSSFAAISTACSFLEQGKCDTVIAGGTNVLTNPDNFAGLDRGHFLSRTGNCNPFYDSANGYCRADGVGAVILKRLGDAQADNDPIFGVIAGSSTNHCGQTVSITRPHEGDQLSLFKHILRHTHTHPADVSYIEMHGTGTQAGDATEMGSVLSTFAWDHRRSNLTVPRPLYLGAVKANVGHSESASGVTALIKVLMMMRYNEIPPHRPDGQLNHHYPADLADRNVHIPSKTTPWRRDIYAGDKRISFLNNFSAAGGNTAILLEDAPCRTASLVSTDPRTVQPVTVSAKTAKALEGNTRAFIEYLERNPATSLPALSYTTTARRAHYKFRILVSGADITVIKAALQRRVDYSIKIKAITAEPPKVVFAFSGQGTIYTGIGRQLFEQVAVFHTDILRFHRIAQRQGFPSFLPLISGEGSVEVETADPITSQLAAVCVQMAFSHLWKLWVGQPTALIGHSLGEYAALYAAGVLSASDTIYLVGSRAQLLHKYCTKSTHLMLAVKAPWTSVVPELADSSCTIACINSPTNVVVSGPATSVKRLSEKFRSKRVEVALLDVPYAFHSAQVEPLLAHFETLASTITFHKPRAPYMSPVLSTVVNDTGILNAAYVTQATRECVNFQGAIEAARDAKLVNDTALWVEIGLHPTCSGMIKQTLGSHVVTAPTLRKDADTWKVLMDSIEHLYQAGVNIQWNEFHRGFEAVHEVLPLPRYQWDLKNYWIPYRFNFCLTKGDDPATFAPQTPLAPSVALSTGPSLSSSVHSVLKEQNSTEKSILLAQSDLHDPRLTPVISGHKVNTAMLCPSSLYADMALTIVKYMLKSNGLLDDAVGLDCGTMSIQRSLVAQPDATSQLLRVSAEAIWSSQRVSLRFFSVDNNNASKLADHASCTVKITEKQNWLDDWKRSAYLTRSRIESLRLAVDTGNSHKLKRGMVYKLFSSLVDYAPSHQGMEQVILDSECLEATAEVKFKVGHQGFDFNPCWIDSLGHIAGFIMNGNGNLSSKEQVFINQGWDAMRCGKPIEHGKTYTTYNRMQLESGTMYAGDTYIFEGQELVAIFEGVKIQGVNRSLLDNLLPGKARVAAAKAAPAAVASKRAAARASVEKPPASSRQKSAPMQDQSSKFKGALQIIAEEAQIDRDDIDPDTEFADLGVDSLLSLTITSRLQQELGIDVSSSTFVEHSTIKALISHIGGDDEAATVESTPSLSGPSEASTPPSVESEYEEHSSTDASTFSGDSSKPNIGVMGLVQKVISQQVGIAVADIPSDLPLADLGIDSLLGLTIMDILSEQMDTQLPSSLFADSETLDDMEANLCKAGVIITSPKPQGVEADGNPQEVTDLAENTHARISTMSQKYDGLTTPPHATSVVLQGSPRTARKILFLFPDGAGSASSYLALPAISPEVVVYGLSCPWLKTPEDLRCSFGHYVAKFLVEIPRRQPHGPYHFGGVSAGGILAYEAAQQLERTMGDQVARLVLLDTPDPVGGLENPHRRLYDFLESVGTFGMNGKAPPWLRPHFDAFLALLDRYEVTRFAGSSTPPATYLIYARDGMCKQASDPRPELRPDDPREMRWLLNNRTDFGGGGWNTLLGAGNLHISVLDDVNHFTILQDGPKIKELAAMMARALHE